MSDKQKLVLAVDTIKIMIKFLEEHGYPASVRALTEVLKELES